MSPFEKLQLDIEGLLLSQDSLLKYATITHVRPRTADEATGINTRLDQILAGLMERNGKKGVSIVIMMPELAAVEANVRHVTGQLEISIEVIENIIVNMGGEGTQISAETYALEIAELLQHHVFKPWSPLVGQPRMITPAPEMVLDKKVVYRVGLKVTHNGAKRLKVALPKMTQDGHEITLTCSTEGAEIFRTLDGTFPGPGNPEASVYDGPFGLPTGTHCLRFAAYKCGLDGSFSEEVEVVVA